ncbi:glycosyltransferase family 2 protein [Cognaticolwellia beringensis]|uniref:Glycosyltransferase family 2 protein n=1 Tax=Cognaticolwellia beringensis TaxID=1967665 RepID=A0A222G3Y2_9GAMM|nr:glycosyltransferase family 2 protein [Cognaticolwellia beringensis]ASP46637.1 glycosyltransferase family 2 protein [Cognaticolwellia beringensis]
MDGFEVAAVIPAFNEEKSIAMVVESLLPYAKVIVVNDLSSDSTAKYALAAGADVVNHKVNQGYDGALNSGFLRAKELGFKKVFTFDADGQHPVEQVTEFIKKLDSYDVVLGVRPKAARFAEGVFARFGAVLWGINDPLCGFKAYNMKVYDMNGGFDSCNSIGTELAIQSFRRGFSLINIPIPISEREFGKPRFGKLFKANSVIFKAMLKMIFTKKV